MQKMENRYGGERTAVKVLRKMQGVRFDRETAPAG